MSGKSADKNEPRERGAMARQIVGTLGSIFAALCCIGTPALLALLASIGVGFLIRDVILVPLLVVFLAINVWGIQRSLRRHGNEMPRIVAIVCSVVIIVAVWFSPSLVLLGLAGLIAVSGWDIYLCRTAVEQQQA
jgi:mercuric ion transport protein